MSSFQMFDIIPTQSEQIMQQFEHRIMQKAISHKIRLTPVEYQQMVNKYIDTYFNNVDIESLLQIAQNICKENQ